MKRAYVGLSSPIAYDYSNKFRVGIGDDVDIQVDEPYWNSYNKLPYPTPILESPYGLMLLYDEIWFLSRALCPPDMQYLPYVRFISETEHFEKIFGKYVDYEADDVRQFVDDDDYFKFVASPGEISTTLVQSIPFNWNVQLSDNSEIFMVSSMGCFGSSGTLETLLIDLVFLSHLGIPSIELITNRYSTRILERLSRATVSHSNVNTVIEPILFDNVPNYLNPNGCYHPTIEDARNDPFLSDFRMWLSEFPKNVSSTEVEEITKEVNENFTRLQADLFDKYLSKNTYYRSAGRGLLNSAINLALPGVGTAIGIGSTALEGRRAANLRWLGFIANQRNRDASTT